MIVKVHVVLNWSVDPPNVSVQCSTSDYVLFCLPFEFLSSQHNVSLISGNLRLGESHCVVGGRGSFNAEMCFWGPVFFPTHILRCLLVWRLGE